MTATNHALTGALIGLLVGEPLLAVPLAVASHFVCDALPHFGSSAPVEVVLRSRWFRNYLVVDASLCFLLVVCLGAYHPQHWLLAAICAFAAASPDFINLNSFVKIHQRKKWRPGWFTKLTLDIQWFARPVGAVVEVVWFASGITLLVPFLRWG
ncbi:MAG TPA: hypothetical protein VK712_03235 [Verrucomicrobiae bacterium]|jgi:hypothetical protein|nr:hypothetical protein [Verrucomicrobiae bacterium]